MNKLSAPLYATLWWLLPLAALAAMIGWETDWGRAVDKRPQPAEAVAPKPVVASVLPEYAIAGGLAARSETVQRTLFNPTRRPAPAPAQENASARIQRGQFALTGTTIVDGKNTAFLRETAGNKSRRVRAGETINGMRVAEVSPDRVKLTLGEDSEELVLKVATNPRPTVQPVAVAAPAQPAPGVTATAPAQAAGPVGQGTTQTLAERRRAARAAQAAAGGEASPPAEGAAAPAMPAAPAPTPAAAPPAPAAALGAPAGAADPRWEQVYQGMRDRAATPAARRATK
jgi:hypothetical protein